jgi:hypothetical protein
VINEDEMRDVTGRCQRGRKRATTKEKRATTKIFKSVTKTIHLKTKYFKSIVRITDLSYSKSF